jgi:glycosyltransferase involved in cell wall biosynthesis
VEHYQNSDVFCLLSVQEGLALVIAQAMACGLPVVATYNTGAEDLIREGVEGFLVRARDSDAARDRITRLKEDRSLRLRMGRLARQRVLKGFSWHEYGNRAVKNLLELEPRVLQ